MSEITATENFYDYGIFSCPSSPSTFSLLPPCLLYTIMDSCDYTQVEKSLASETNLSIDLNRLTTGQLQKKTLLFW